MLLRKAASPNSSWGEVFGEAAARCQDWPAKWPVWEMGHGIEGAVGVGHGLLFQVLLNSFFAQTHMPQAFEWVTYLTTELFKWGQG